ncbi:hypothetical protein [Paenibacillus sp. JCM 10914]|uniref:hypothetical protein n=1 Tax=Paenibacillus sp. JCM 10914 TaxID=1236974 RepID=UPI000567E09E|nr:hypothetical protein [Paenibacillus sp. JCM 10914]
MPRKRNIRKSLSSDGSVSVFLIIVLAAVFMFVAVFIDFSRISALKVQSERLTRAAVRSVMSSYEPELQQAYGLYALGATSADLIMGNVLNDSLRPGDRSDAFRLMAMELDSSGMELQRPLGTYEIFNRQIIEDMKYKAPIDFTLELLTKFKPLSQSMKEASNTVDVLKKLRRLYDSREAALDEMLEKQRKAGEQAIRLSKLVMDPPDHSIIDSSLGGSISTAEDAAAQYEDYKVKRQEDADRAPEEEKLYTLLLLAYQSGVSGLGSRITAEVSRFQSNRDKLLLEADTLWEEANSLNEEMKQVIKEAETRSSNLGYDQVTNDITPGSAEASAEEAEIIQSIRQQADGLIYSADMLEELKQEIDVQRDRSLSVVEAGLSVHSSLGGEVMKGTIMNASRSLQNYISNYGIAGGGNVIDRRQAQLEQFRTSDKERKAMEKQADQQLKQATKVIKAINGMDQQQAVMDEFRKLQQFYDESMEFNAVQADRNKGKSMDDDPYEAGKSAMDNMDGMFGFMGSVLGNARDELFQNEYAVHYFQHFDIKRLSGLVEGAGSGGGIGQEFHIADQEVEYILYGFHNPVGNIAGAYAEIFSTRLAIRTMEGLVVNSRLGNPLAILAAAILYGVEKAIEDMIRLCQKGSLPLSKYVPVELTYRDHLRIFMFIHSNNEKKLSRMLALIRWNTGINPAERATYASGEVRSAMRLWFLPGVTKSLGVVFGSGGDEVTGNRYIVTRKADFSY